MPDASALVRILCEAALERRVLAGFDFAIGVPARYGDLTGLKDFRTALDMFGSAEGWENFFDVAGAAAEISVRRPFYPRTSSKGVERTSLVDGIGVDGFEDLLRRCEKGGAGRRTACSVFWTLGGNQVGRAAISGWRDVVRPALARGARLWPFDGPLDELARTPSLVLCETYPADAYAGVGARFLPRESKRRQGDRRAKAPAILDWAHGADVDLGAARGRLVDGFGGRADGEDAFDALVGLLKMIRICQLAQPSMVAAPSAAITTWEGWILGR